MQMQSSNSNMNDATNDQDCIRLDLASEAAKRDSIMQEHSLADRGQSDAMYVQTAPVHERTGAANTPLDTTLPRSIRHESLFRASTASWRTLKKYATFVGPGFIIAVSYIDPGNYSTDVAAGALFEYKMLFVLFLTNLFAIFLQGLSCKRATRHEYHCIQ